jgi:hypothetical protein
MTPGWQVVIDSAGPGRLLGMPSQPGADGEVARLRELGAAVLREVKEPGTGHVVMADPGGNEFCAR